MMDRLYMVVFVRGFRKVSALSKWVDELPVDGFYEFAATVVRGLHSLLLFFQNGRISRYALVMLFGAAAITSLLISLYQRTP
jgi:NADH:ubiquinone oxidoreductase subunit 5 (subunit L)/multisubunit Na+/H+ antiporter MnhA subunit